jgi:hypothetical protein
MTDHRTTYYRRLAIQLRGRNLPEAEVLAALEEVQQYVLATGEDPELDFGPPARYAERWARRTGKTPGAKVVLWGVIAAISYLIVVGILTIVEVELHPVTMTMVPLPLAVFVLSVVGLAVIAGIAADRFRRLPAGFDAKRAATAPAALVE